MILDHPGSSDGLLVSAWEMNQYIDFGYNSLLLYRSHTEIIQASCSIVLLEGSSNGLPQSVSLYTQRCWHNTDGYSGKLLYLPVVVLGFLIRAVGEVLQQPLHKFGRSSEVLMP